jgi:hypothetical protein
MAIVFGAIVPVMTSWRPLGDCEFIAMNVLSSSTVNGLTALVLPLGGAGVAEVVGSGHGSRRAMICHPRIGGENAQNAPGGQGLV